MILNKEQIQELRAAENNLAQCKLDFKRAMCPDGFDPDMVMHNLGFTCNLAQDAVNEIQRQLVNGEICRTNAAAHIYSELCTIVGASVLTDFLLTEIVQSPDDEVSDGS